jgi:amino acid permease
MEGFTMYVLAKFAERYDADSYGQLIRRALGRKTAAGLSAVLLLYLWGSCVAYLVRQGTGAGRTCGHMPYQQLVVAAAGDCRD